MQFERERSKNIPFLTSFQNIISALYSYQAPVQPALRLLCGFSFICKVCVQHVHNGLRAVYSPLVGEYTALRQNRQVVDEWQSRIRNGAKCRCAVLETRFWLYFDLPIILNDRCWIYLFFSATLFLGYCVYSKMLNEFSILTRRIKL